ncbi:MAG: citrate transporter [Bacteroidia bacterium]|nr:citrate transporter [Bacteroidia bacterium]MCZ2277686.1 citrate transporter [Bacteroidia bacterium]
MQLLMLLLNSANEIQFYGIAIEFILFGLTLIGVALFHHHTMKVALTGLVALLLYKFIFTDFSIVNHIIGDSEHEGEWHIIVNLFGLLTGFAVLARHFEESYVPVHLPEILPLNWRGGWLLLLIVLVLSSFLDNIAAAMIGASIANVIYKGKVHVGFLAAIVAASNAGGAGSVVGDTTTTMMWIDGVSPVDVLHAYAGSFGAFLVFSGIAAIQQQKLQPLVLAESANLKPIDWGRIMIVALILGLTILTNVLFDFPALGVWAAILIGTLIRKTNWSDLPHAVSGSIFLLSLVLCASLMPVGDLPDASWHSSLSLGFISSVFDNIPLTKLALDQGGYDWGVLAYAVGFGGSMIWFGSSAGVAVSGIFPNAKSVVNWVKSGWHIIIAYMVGFAFLLLTFGWHPHTPHREYKKKNRQAIESVEQNQPSNPGLTPN